jgi:hypothetical protein
MFTGRMAREDGSVVRPHQNGDESWCQYTSKKMCHCELKSDVSYRSLDCWLKGCVLRQHLLMYFGSNKSEHRAASKFVRRVGPMWSVHQSLEMSSYTRLLEMIKRSEIEYSTPFASHRGQDCHKETRSSPCKVAVRIQARNECSVDSAHA